MINLSSSEIRNLDSMAVDYAKFTFIDGVLAKLGPPSSLAPHYFIMGSRRFFLPTELPTATDLDICVSCTYKQVRALSTLGLSMISNYFGRDQIIIHPDQFLKEEADYISTYVLRYSSLSLGQIDFCMETDSLTYRKRKEQHIDLESKINHSQDKKNLSLFKFLRDQKLQGSSIHKFLCNFLLGEVAV